MRSVNGYPQQLARATGLSVVDMTCSGSTVEHVIKGGQFFQGPQIAAVSSATRLVTLTSGGNDISYIGDLLAMGYHNRGNSMDRIVGLFLTGPHSNAERDFKKVEIDMVAAIIAVRRRAPRAQFVVASYPAVFPTLGSCPALGLTERQVARMRPIAAKLNSAMRSAATKGGAIFVDMTTIGIGHDACAPEPWINGLSPATGSPFHLTQAGAEAVAREIAHATNLVVHN